MQLTKEGQAALEIIRKAAKDNGIDISGGKVRRTSSRFCLGVEHGDYNGTELLGVGTDRFIWLAYKPNSTGKIRLFSANFPDDKVVEFDPANVPEPKSPEIAHTWGRFPCGIGYILKREGYKLTHGIDGVLYGNIPGGGMSRSASLCNNLILSIFDANGIEAEDKNTVVDLAQAVENDYIGSPCGKLDQTMVIYAREGMATHYNPKDRSVEYVPIAAGGLDFRIVVLDTGTDRPGLEKSLRPAEIHLQRPEAILQDTRSLQGRGHRDGRADIPCRRNRLAGRLQDIRPRAGDDVRHCPNGSGSPGRADAGRRRQGRFGRAGASRQCRGG